MGNSPVNSRKDVGSAVSQKTGSDEAMFAIWDIVCTRVHSTYDIFILLLMLRWKGPMNDQLECFALGILLYTLLELPSKNG